VLIRPDGFVAWRASALTSTPQPLLDQVLSRILCRPTAPTRL
jgi:Aromatic-ring hydroxylase, C-terminal